MMLVSVLLINIFLIVSDLMKLIVGIGNPGKEYENTRHNVGFMVLDAYLGDVSYQEKFNALYTKKIIDGETVYFLKPLTYVNNSGQAVAAFMKYFDIDIKDLLVIHDDLDEDVGKYKLKINSSSGGHNGIKSIISHLNSQAFLRLKIGINSEFRKDTIDFVLGKFSKSEMEVFKGNLEIYKDIIDSFVKNGTDKTMNIYNTKVRG